MSAAESPFEMTLSLNVLEHLGVNLYSNVPAVISEVIANAWDADADRVEINVDHENQRIIITDDGIGMGRDDINNKFLKVGYRRRDEPNGDKTAKGRVPMGRKGIGKLSLFSIASKIEVHSMKGGEKNALMLDADEIENWIKTHGDKAPYCPRSLQFSQNFSFPDANALPLEHGTRIVIHGLRRSVTRMTAKSLRKRLARRFGIRCTEKELSIILNDEPISMSDRDYFGKLEYIFLYGDDARIAKAIDEKRTAVYHRPRQFPDDGGMDAGTRDYSVHGWIGLAKHAKDLAGDAQLPPNERDNLNKVSVMARQKLILEDVLGRMRFSSQFVHYAIGEIHADFMDIDGMKDIATSSRQGVIEHDPRAEALFKFLHGELKDLRDKRDDVMRKKAEDTAIELIPALRGWFDQMKPDTREAARVFLGESTESP